MKRLFLTGALVAATLAPVIAQAQDHDQHRREQRDDRGDRRHDRGDAGHDRHDVRQDRREFRQDRREAWRDYRDSHPGDYRRSGWNAPFRYRAFGIGAVVPGAYWGSRYYVNDWQRFRLPPPRYGFYRYVRHYDDVLLVNTRNGRVVRVYRGFYR